MATRSPKSRSRSTLAILFLLYISTTAAETVLLFGNNALPTCAQQCPVIIQAQAACVPPSAPVTNQAAYESCFCQSGYLKTITTDTTPCSGVCSGNDLTQLSEWYSNTCADGGVAAAAAISNGGGTTTAVDQAATTAGAGAASTSSGTTGNSGQTTATTSTTSGKHGW